MTRQVADKADPTIEDVRAQFESWRKTRKSRQPIPDKLWQAAVDLSKNHSIYIIAKTLRLDYTKLKNLTRKRPDNDPPIMKEISPAFIELDFGSSPTTACECSIDIKGSDGTQMKMQFKGNHYFDPLELCKAFWRKS
jgi:hypothetical protein